MFSHITFVEGQHGLQSIPTNQGSIGKKSLFTKKMSNPPPKSPVFRGMLRKTGISPYIWWFWGAFGGLGGLQGGLAAVWCYMGGYGDIWCAMVIYRTVLYIRFALYIQMPNQYLLLHLLLIASVHSLYVLMDSAKGQEPPYPLRDMNTGLSAAGSAYTKAI